MLRKKWSRTTHSLRHESEFSDRTTRFNPLTPFQNVRQQKNLQGCQNMDQKGHKMHYARGLLSDE